MDDYQQAYRECLADLDVRRARMLWKETMGHLPQPATDHDMLIILHIARTQAESSPFGQRAYSHRWLSERGHPSCLPDNLKPRAEQIHPVVVKAVGVSVESVSPEGRARAKAIEKAMSDAVAECYADGEERPEVIKSRMQEARKRFH